MPLRIAAAVGFGLAASLAQAQATPAGLWKTIDDNSHKEKSLVRISEAGGVYTGRIEKLLDPATKPDAVCDKCADDRKDKPLVGLTIITGVKQSDSDKSRWDGGEILDPKDGKSYKVRLTPEDGGKSLAVRGYIGAPLLGRTQTWIRVE
ncbi:MAG: DUF2147 domain-containing protein [Proteobacteria bacterium]|nr:DUF2147 domain-containing protein [Pseudomonadota bacterium]